MVSLRCNVINPTGKVSDARGGTHPQKVRVGDVRGENLKLYLYKFAKKWGLFYILLAKKMGAIVYYRDQNLCRTRQFCRKLGVNWIFQSKISVQNLNMS